MSEIKSLCVFCGSQTGVDPLYREAAEYLGRQMAAEGIHLVYGAGGIGIMGAVARACLDAGGTVTGVIPEHLMQAEVALPGLDDLIVVPDMHTRKRTMFERSDGFVVLPGGFGTMDETFEILTWKQLKLHDKPVIIADVAGYWAPFLRFAESMMEQGFIRPANMALFSTVQTVEEVIPVARREASPSRGAAASDLF